MSLRYRMLLPLIIFLLGTALATAWTARIAAAQAEAQINAEMQDVAQVVSQPPTFVLTQTILERLKMLSQVEIIRVSHDEIFATVELLTKEDVSRLNEGESSKPEVLAGREYRWRQVQLPQGHPNGEDQIFLLYPEDRRRQTVTEAVRPVVLQGLFAGIIAVVATLILTNRFIQKLRRVQQQTESIASGDFQTIPLPKAQDEIYELARAVNSMSAQLSRYEEALKEAERKQLLAQLSGGLAHQLRNAVSGARLALQYHQQAEEQAREEESIVVALRQLERIELIITQFLHLGRDSAQATVPFDLRAVINQAVSLYLPQGRHTGIVLTWESPANPVILQGDPGTWTHVVVNLIANALEAVPPGSGRVNIVLEQASDHGVRLEVRDNGLGPAPEISAKIFEEFVTSKPNGIGLGLAVVKRALDQFGATISWFRDKDETVFQIEIPPPNSTTVVQESFSEEIS